MSRDSGPMPSSLTIYHAAPLFCAREAYFNLQLTRCMERDFGHRVILPQRDGFEFGQLHSAFESMIEPHEVASAVGTIVYYLDVGHFLASCGAVIANLDEPLDEGVITEICYARMIGKPVIGFRTDVRTPYGEADNVFAGMHFFPPFQCHEFVRRRLLCRSDAEAEIDLRELARLLDAAARRHAAAPTAAEDPAAFAPIRRAARLLFDEIEDLHSPSGLAEVAKRYLRNSAEFETLRPRLTSIPHS